MSAAQLFNNNDDNATDVGRERLFMNDGALNILRDVFHGSSTVNTPDDDVDGFVEYHGNSVDAQTALVFRHILDEFDDHLGRSIPPKFTFRVGEFTDLGNNDTYKAKDDGPGDKYNAPVEIVYDIDGRKIVSDYFAIDNVMFEMYPAMKKDGGTAENHGIGWINMYLTKQRQQQLQSATILSIKQQQQHPTASITTNTEYNEQQQ